MMKLLLVALLAFVAVHVQAQTSVTAGIDLTGQGVTIKASLKANTTYTVKEAISQFQAVVDVKADCQVWFGAHLQFTNLPTGWNQVVNVASIGVNVGFGLFVDVQGAINSAILQSPPVPAFGQEIANGFNAAALALNNATGYSYLQVTYDPESKRISVALPSSLPLIIFGKVQSQASATLNNPFNFIGGANQTITFDANTAITFRSQVANAITVARTNAATSGQLSAIANIGRGLGIYVNVSLAVQASHDSILRISYNAQDLINQGIKDEANLKLAVWNEITNTWDLGNWVSVVNTTAHWIEARVPHFSTWAPIEALQAAANITTPTGAPGTVSIQANIDLTGQGLVIKTALKAGIKYTVTTLVGFQAIVDVKADCNVWFGAHLQFTNLPTGWNQVVNVASIGVNVGFGLFVDVQGALNSVILQSPPVPAFGQEIANGFNAAALALTNATGAPVYTYLQVTYDPESKRISLALPSNLPLIIFGKIQSQATATLNNPFNFIGGANQTIAFDANTAITFRSQVGNTIVVARGNYAASGALNAVVKAGRGLGIYVNVSLAVQAAQDSTLRISYNAQDLINAGIKNEANLRLAFFNEQTNTWDFGDWVSVVNTTAHWIEARVPHFSTWSPIEASPSPTGTASQTSISMVLMAALAIIAALFQ